MPMFDRRSMLAALGASALPFPTFAATPRSDPEWVLALLTTLHPGLYRYQTPADFTRRHASFAAAWARSGVIEARFVLLSRLLAAIRCGHSYVNPYNQSDAMIARLTSGRRLLPFRFRWIDDEMVVTGDPHGTGIAPGTRVVRVDGRPSRDILSALVPLARADGGNDAKRRDLMEVRGEDEFEAFDLFQPLLFPVGSRVDLALVYPDGRRERRSVATVDRAARLAARPADPPKGDDAPQWRFERRGAAVLLTMNNWALYDSKWDWRSWLDQRFASMARDGVRGLVIDLRANEGGLECGDEILARLIDRPLPANAARRLVRFRAVPADLRAPLDTWDKSFVTLGARATPVDARFFALPPTGNGGSAAITPKPRFAGKVAVLTSATNSSATFGFAQRVREHRLATLVGGATGGNRRGINGGAYFFVRLPESGIEFDLPLIGYFPDRPQPDAGILPDVAVPLTAAAIVAGRDEALARALSLVA